jgi:hypothetical protein
VRIASEVCLELQACNEALARGDVLETMRLEKLVELTGYQVALAKALVKQDAEENRLHVALLRGYTAMQEILGGMLRGAKTGQPPGSAAAAM